MLFIVSLLRKFLSNILEVGKGLMQSRTFMGNTAQKRSFPLRISLLKKSLIEICIFSAVKGIRKNKGKHMKWAT